MSSPPFWKSISRKLPPEVLTSTCGAIYYGHPPQKAPFDETSWTNVDGEMSAYVRVADLHLRAMTDPAANGDRRGGDGGYMVICQCDDHRPRKQRVAQLGIRKVMESDGPEYSVMQLHPRD